ncbi:MAG TPA: FAD-binding domain-containing protein [Chitinophagaceae bacterium]|nr:FAD-binding domain-containing protein [Chitinophagaceae bacterium]
MTSFHLSYSQIRDRIEAIDPIKYARTRNFTDGAVTYLSPFISRGVISTQQVMQSVLSRGYKPYQAEKFLQELAWREYYQRVWQAKGDQIWTDLKQEQAEVKHHEMIAAVENAATGIEAVDQHIEKLYETGYMHNHVRMYVASITCNVGGAHWKQPAQWMYFHLLDGDIASNNCSWQWVAGAFASKKYYCNQENINKYTGSFQRQSFLDQSYEDIAGMEVPRILQATSSPLRITNFPATEPLSIDPSKPTLIYNSYNLDPIWRQGEDVNRVLLLEPSHFEKYPVSEKVLAFILFLGQQIKGVQVHVGEIRELSGFNLISKEHPAFCHYPGIKDDRNWMFPTVTGYYPSFFSFWKKCERELARM